MGLPDVINLDKDKCQHCLACLLVCPVKLCNIVEKEGISVKADLCIGCGECVRACKEKGHSARSGLDDFSGFRQAVVSGVPVGVLIAPAAAVNYGDLLPQVITALRQSGVKYVFDVSFGAEIAANAYLKLVKSGAAQPLIAQPCPAIVSFIEIYHAELIPYLAPTHSPALAAAAWVKSQALYKNLKLAFLGPCLAKRREVHDPNTGGLVSYNVTFQSLNNYFREQGLSLENLEPAEFDSPEPERAVVFSRPGGLTETFLRFGIPVKKSEVPHVEGPQEVYSKYLPELMKDIEKGMAPVLVDILNCQHGCNTGPAITHCLTHYQADQIMDLRKEKQFAKHDLAEEARPNLFEEYYNLVEAKKIDLSRAYADKSSNKYLREPSEEEEDLTWLQMHKHTVEERQINCASCGYGYCRSMMKAIVNGLNHIESCKYYLFKENELNLKKVQEQATEIQKSRDDIAAWNEELEKTVNLRTTAIRNLLNNAGQGFLTFGENLLVNEEYSIECIRIFGREIAGKKFSRLVYPEQETTFIDSLINEIFINIDDDLVLEVYLPLLPKEVEIGSKHIQIEYRIINDATIGSKSCMAILTDVTEKRLLENQMEHEKNSFKMVVKVVVNYNDFLQTIKDYGNFCNSLVHEIISSESSLEDKINEIFRHVHTFKGNFSQFYMTWVTQRLHDLESQISAINKKLDEGMGEEQLIRLIGKYDLNSWVQEDLERIEEVLGHEFISTEDKLTISKSKLLEIEKKVESILSPAECRILLTELRKLRYRSFDSMLVSYQDYVMKLAERNKKSIYPVEVEGDRVFVDPERYNDFIRSLAHVFRNAVDHGIETLDERIESGKEDYGHIKCFISSQDDRIILVIADDGRGIDCNEIRGKIVEKGLLNQEDMDGLSQEEILSYIFKDSFSTKDTVTQLSGRGIGLSAVKGELEKLGGTVDVKTFNGKGTEFRFVIPLENEQLWDIAASSMINPLVETTNNFLSGLSLQIKSIELFDVTSTEKLLLHKFTSLISIKGALEGLFVMSMEEAVLRKVLRNFILGELSEDEETVYMEDVLAECTNNILGNSLKLFPGLNEMIIIDTPVFISSKDALVKYQESRISSCSMLTNEGKLSLSLVLPLETEK